MTENEPGGLAAALEIERRYRPEQWAERIALIENEQHREVAADYLRGMYRRVQTVRKLRRETDA
jgi:hypothetical protein